MVAAALLLSMATTAHAAHNIGIGKADITGPTADVVFMGYGEGTQHGAGLLNRLYARAFLVHDTDTNERIVFVNCDLQGVYQLVHQEVLQRLETKYGGVYTAQNVVLHATHTHAGPGGLSAYFIYAVSILGYINDNFDVVVGGILAAIDQAHGSLAPGTVRLNSGQISDGGKNRSPLAYLANPEDERRQYSDDRDYDLRMLQFFAEDGKTLRGILALFPVHPVSLTAANHLVSGDNKGYAGVVHRSPRRASPHCCHQSFPGRENSVVLLDS